MEEETPKVADDAAEEKPNEDEVEVMMEEGADDGEEESEERIRGGGKVSDRSGGRNSRRYAPYKTAGDEETSEGAGRVFVGNLSWHVSWQDLKDHFKKSGHEVTRADVLKGPDGRSKGCGLVEFATIQGAQHAILTLNDTELHGRQIFVREDREDRSSGSQGRHHAGSHFSSGEKSQNCRVYVGNLSWDVAWQGT